MKTAVEWYSNAVNDILTARQHNKIGDELLIQNLLNAKLQAKEMEKQQMIDLVEKLKDYTREAHNILGFDEREPSEFVDFYYNGGFKSE
jgi:hypothetical protein